MVCDSAHKTLPVLTGGAYLHIGRAAPAAFREGARAALALFGSTSPSYLTLASLDLCNRYLAEEGPERIRAAAGRLSALRGDLAGWGWASAGTEPLKLTLDAAACGWTGFQAAEYLRAEGVEPEYEDRDYVVLMASGSTGEEAFERAADALQSAVSRRPVSRPALPPARGERALSVREALFAPREAVAAEESLGRICGAPTVSCPPAIPVAVSGERIGPEALALFRHYGVETVDVVREERLSVS